MTDYSQKDIDEIVYRLNNESIRVSVFGEFSSGKTTFLNALINEDILTTAYEPTTAVPTSDKGVSEYLSKSDKKNLREWLLSAYPEYNDKGGEKKVSNFIDLIEQYRSRDFILDRNLPDGVLYNATRAGLKNIIEININHPFYIYFMKPVYENNNEQASTILRLLFCSLVRAEQSASGDVKVLRRIRTNFSMNLEDLIEGFLEN